MNHLEVFCRQVRSRSEEHRKAMQLLYTADLSSQIVSVLRQELDSMIRVIYLLSISDMAYRDDLVKASVEGKSWTKKSGKGRITDRDMVNLADKLQKWTESVYRFGCAFIHLSAFHDHQDRDPMSMISDDDKAAILKHMRYYHGGPSEPDPTFKDLIVYLPMVFEKISSNLDHYVEELESGEIISVK
jgi:hypothetical protein